MFHWQKQNETNKLLIKLHTYLNGERKNSDPNEKQTLSQITTFTVRCLSHCLIKLCVFNAYHHHRRRRHHQRKSLSSSSHHLRRCEGDELPWKTWRCDILQMTPNLEMLEGHWKKILLLIKKNICLLKFINKSNTLVLTIITVSLISQLLDFNIFYYILTMTFTIYIGNLISLIQILKTAKMYSIQRRKKFK